MTREISNNDDIIDSRDFIEYLEEKEAELSDLLEAYMENNDLEEFWDLKEEVDILRDVASEGESYAPDWKYGETLIRESYWVEYVEELLKDIGDLPSDIPWYIEIDWEATANHIKMDYSTIDFGGVDYYIRN